MTDICGAIGEHLGNAPDAEGGIVKCCSTKQQRIVTITFVIISIFVSTFDLVSDIWNTADIRNQKLECHSYEDVTSPQYWQDGFAVVCIIGMIIYIFEIFAIYMTIWSVRKVRVYSETSDGNQEKSFSNFKEVTSFLLMVGEDLPTVVLLYFATQYHLYFKLQVSASNAGRAAVVGSIVSVLWKVVQSYIIQCSAQNMKTKCYVLLRLIVLSVMLTFSIGVWSASFDPFDGEIAIGHHQYHPYTQEIYEVQSNGSIYSNATCYYKISCALRLKIPNENFVNEYEKIHYFRISCNEFVNGTLDRSLKVYLDQYQEYTDCNIIFGIKFNPYIPALLYNYKIEINNKQKCIQVPFSLIGYSNSNTTSFEWEPSMLQSIIENENISQCEKQVSQINQSFSGAMFVSYKRPQYCDHNNCSTCFWYINPNSSDSNLQTITHNRDMDMAWAPWHSSSCSLRKQYSRSISIGNCSSNIPFAQITNNECWGKKVGEEKCWGK